MDQPPRVRILDTSANEAAETVAQGEADFGICSIPSLEPSLEFETLFDDRMVLAVPPSYPLAQSDSLSWRELDGLPLIFPARGTGNRLVIDEALAKARIQTNWTYEVARSSTALDLVQSGLGVALLPETALSGAALSHCAMKNPEVARPVGLITRRGTKTSQTVQTIQLSVRKIATDLA